MYAKDPFSITYSKQLQKILVPAFLIIGVTSKKVTKKTIKESPEAFFIHQFHNLCFFQNVLTTKQKHLNIIMIFFNVTFALASRK